MCLPASTTVNQRFILVDPGWTRYPIDVKGLFIVIAALLAPPAHAFLLPPLYFGPGEATLSEEARAQLTEGLRKSGDVREVRFVVRGHSDRVESAKYKQTLSTARAEVVRDYLVGLGAAADDIRVMSFGSSVSMTACAQRDAAVLVSCLAPDRRVTVEIQPPM
jgi:outer membrane protein OmpA-like peptidoglycan-associated protein